MKWMDFIDYRPTWEKPRGKKTPTVITVQSRGLPSVVQVKTKKNGGVK